MSPDLNAADALRILEGLGLEPLRVRLVARASTCEVWRGDTRRGSVALRLLVPRSGKSADFAADAAVRRGVLTAGDPRVSRPLAWHGDHPELPAGPP